MASIHTYGDFGKATKDVLTGGRTGLFQFDTKVCLSGKSADGISFNINSVNKGDKVTADAKGSYKNKNLQVDATVTSASQLKTAVSYSNIAPGLKVGLSGTLPDVNSAKLSIDYVMQYLNLKTSLGLTSTPKVEMSATTGSQGFVVGGEVGYDTAKQAMSKYSAAFGYIASEWSAAVSITDKGDVLKAQLAHNMGSNSVAAAEAQQTLSSSTTTFTVGYQTKLANGALAKVRLNNAGILGMLYEHTVASGAKVAACYQLDVTNLESAPKYGLAVDLSS